MENPKTAFSGTFLNFEENNLKSVLKESFSVLLWHFSTHDTFYIARLISKHPVLTSITLKIC